MQVNNLTTSILTLTVAALSLLPLCSCKGRANILDDGQVGNSYDEEKLSQPSLRLQGGASYNTNLVVTLYVDNYYSDQISNHHNLQCGVYYREKSSPEYTEQELTEDLESYATTFTITNLNRYTQYLITPFVRNNEYPYQEYVGNSIQKSTY